LAIRNIPIGPAWTWTAGMMPCWKAPARELGHEEEYAGAVILVIDADGVEIGRFTAVHPPADPS
jgi:hypothetical protein